MKNKLNSVNFIALFFLAMFTFSCKKAGESSPVQATPKSLFELLQGKNVKLDGHISLTASSMSFSDLPAGQIDVNAHFTDKSGNFVKADKLQVSTFDIEGSPSFRYYKHFSSSLNNFSNIASSLFGNTVKFTVSSKEFGDVTREMHSPMTVKMDLSSIKNDQILKRTGLTIKWNADNARVALRDGEEFYVGAAVIYQAGISENTSQQGLPSQNVTVFKYALDANGEITFTPEELATLPNSGFVTILMGRAEQSVVNTTTGQVLGITSLATSASQPFQILE